MKITCRKEFRLSGNYNEEAFLPLSGLQHLLFCKRQCALIHVEQLWEENVFTAQGRVLHENAHNGSDETDAGRRITRGLRIVSRRLGLNGTADVVEFKGKGKNTRIFPVEYKNGRPKTQNCDEVQLCAQAMCLEEMTGINISEGALFYGRTKRRTNVTFTPALRELTQQTAGAFHELLRHGRTPAAVYTEKCAACSLEKICLPRLNARNASAYIQSLFL